MINKHLILPLSFEVAYDTLTEIAMYHKKEIIIDIVVVSDGSYVSLYYFLLYIYLLL